MAQMVDKAAHSEMRIGMTTAAFGNVEIHTVVHANDVGVLIGSEKGDLRSLLANELPGIASNLQQQNLRLNQVNFQHNFASNGDPSSGGDSRPRYFAAPAGSTANSALLPELDRNEPEWSAAEYASGSSSGLNVVA